MARVVDEEFAEFVRAAQGPLTRSALLLSGDLATAQDLTQEALVKVAQRWSRLKDQDPRAYARRIIYRDNVSRWRSVRREDLVAETPDRGSDPYAAVDESLDLRAALAALPPRQRAVVVLRYYEDLTEAQVAEALGVSVGTVKSQHHDAVARLRTLLPGIILDDSVGTGGRR